jgi:hypothetical protein
MLRKMVVAGTAAVATALSVASVNAWCGCGLGGFGLGFPFFGLGFPFFGLGFPFWGPFWW